MSPCGTRPRKVNAMSDDLNTFEPDDGTGGLPGFVVFLVGALVGALVVGVVWVAVGMLSGSSGSPAPTAARGSLAARSAHSASPTPTKGCPAVFAAQTPVLQAAAAALGQWQVHTDEMNDFVTGSTTLDGILASWDRARVPAQRLDDQLTTALAKYRARRVHCPAAAAALTGVSPGPGTCGAAVVARDGVIQSAARTARTWSAHITDMEAARLGNISGAQLRQMWLAGWRGAVRQLDAYHTNLGLAQGVTC